MIPERYNKNNLKSVIMNPRKGLRRILAEFNRTIIKWHFKMKFGNGINIMEEDWDNLIILDSCRYDKFELINELDGDLDWKISKASHSKEFYKENFPSEEYHDVVYATANPYGIAICGNKFHESVSTFSGDITYDFQKQRVDTVTTENGEILLDRHVKNLLPGHLTNMAIELYDRNPNKKLIVHYMQPHKPYLSTYAEMLRKKLMQDNNVAFDRFMTVDQINNSDKNVIRDLMHAAMSNIISPQELNKLYDQNLRIVLDHVEYLLSHIQGKTVITADHGELLGELRGGQRFNHHEKLYCQELRKIPFHTLQIGKRRQTWEEKPKKKFIRDISDLNNQLSLLGYKSK